ncbi:MAG: carbohydrate ABC transporter permease [Candidatus Dormiibacterota bacterium]
MRAASQYRGAWVGRSGRYLLIYLVSAIVLVVALFPFLYALESSLRPSAALFSTTPWTPPPYWTLQNYADVILQSNFPSYFRNSVFVGLSTAVLSVLIGAPAGYSLARLRIRAKNIIATTVLLVYMVPGVLILVPMYLLFAALHLEDSDLGLVVAYTTFSVPFAIWLLRAFFVSIPIELEDAARVDGCSVLGVLRWVALPLAAPGLMTAGIYSFILAWNEVLLALVFITSDNQKTIAIAISSAFGQFNDQWNLVLPSTVLAGLPVLAFFWVLSRYLVRGLLAGGVKG